MSTHGTTGRFQREELVGKYLTFALGNEEYSVPVLKVREIIKIMDITAVPQVAPLARCRAAMPPA